MPFTGLLEFNPVTIVPVTVYGADMFNYFFTLILVTGLISFSLGALFRLLRG